MPRNQLVWSNLAAGGYCHQAGTVAVGNGHRFRFAAHARCRQITSGRRIAVGADKRIRKLSTFRIFCRKRVTLLRCIVLLFRLQQRVITAFSQRLYLRSASFVFRFFILSADFRGKGASPTNHCWYQSSRVIALLCGTKISAVRHLVLSQSTRVTDRRTDGQNYDSQDRPRICSRGKNYACVFQWRGETRVVLWQD